jgi:hypothetical protein
MTRRLRNSILLILILFTSGFSYSQEVRDVSYDFSSGSSPENIALRQSEKPAILINEQKQTGEKLLAYPNPSNGYFTVEVSGIQEMRITLEILDITGRVVFKNEFPVTGVLSEKIDLQHLNRGMYFLRLMEGKEITTLKLMFK